MKNVISSSLFFTLIFLAQVLHAQFQYEPNDDFINAYPIILNTTYNAAIYQTGDIDIYKFDIQTGSVLEINGSSFPSNLEPVITLYDGPSDLNELITFTNLNSNFIKYFKVCSAGTYYLKIFDADNNNSNALLYAISVTPDISDIYEYGNCNDIITNASPIETGQVIQGAINSAGDVDYYKFEVFTESVLNIKIENVPNSIRMTTALYDTPSELTNLVMWTSNSAGDDVSRYWKVCKSGIYYLKLFDSSNNRNSQLYNLLIEVDNSDIYEYGNCNDIITNASPIETGQVIQGAINSAGDVDYYKFEVFTESVLNIKIENVPNSIRMTTALYDTPSELTNLVMWTSNSAGDDVSRYWKVCKSGIYYLKLFDSSNNDRSSQLYNLLIEIDSSDIYECNDTLTEAYQLQLCTDTLFANINIRDDHDYFSFNAPANILINIEVSDIPGNIDMELELIDYLGNIIDHDSGNNGNKVKINFRTVQDGVYTVHLYDDGNNEFSPELYQLAINLIPEFNLAPDLKDMCIDESPAVLSGGSPLGGYYSGAGVDSVTGIFSPILAGIGMHNIIFTYTDTILACSVSVNTVITVHDLPNVSLSLANDTILVSEAPFALHGGMPAGGIYSGTGVDSITRNFNPLLAGVGSHQIIYTYTDIFGCTNSSLDTIKVVQLVNTLIAIPPDRSIVISPNPFFNKFTINTKNLSGQEVEIILFNINKVLVYHSIQKAAGHFEINFKDNPPGVYFLLLKTDQKSYLVKLLKV